MDRNRGDNAINNELRDPQKHNWQKRGEQARNQPKHYNCRAGIPDDFEHSWDIAKRREALSPSNPEVPLLCHAWILPSSELPPARRTKRLSVGVRRGRLRPLRISAT